MESFKLTIAERLEALRALMKENNMSAYIVLSSDYHNSEYVGDFFKCREYMSGFTGSAGYLCITENSAALWTDGRYFLQAEAQISGTEFKLMKLDMEGTPSITEYIKEHVKDGGVIGIDGMTVTKASIRRYLKDLNDEGEKYSFNTSLDLVGKVWTDRPRMSGEPIRCLSDKISGESVNKKLAGIRKLLKEKGAEGMLMSSLMDICWLLNIRGNDIAYTPVVLSYLYLTEDECTLYVKERTLSPNVLNTLSISEVIVRTYVDVYEDMQSVKEKSIYLDPESINDKLYESIKKGVKIIEGTDLTLIPKACKNDVEIANMKHAHIKDGVALTKFIYYLKTNINSEEFTEISVAEKLDEFRQQQEGYMGQSFAPIIGYEEHGAIIHYSATPETDVKLSAKGLLLMDTGGQYEGGTTDVTRTVSLGPVTDRQKKCYTAVLKGHLELLDSRFTEGIEGCHLDAKGRDALWKMGLDYRHGTGHGVGYMLSVHEGPQRISKKADGGKDGIIKAGMITSDEPGVYLPGEFGVRIENLMVCVADEKNEYGQFLHFEALTMVPFDRKCIDESMLSSEDKRRLNAYNKECYKKLSGFLTESEKSWLAEETKPIL
ncbi:MAG: aminopeptidase P family protein [Lachnospiraceae bacterium]|nr:aminopeptidase P family protein [Lachnospiraceae bacterium]